MCVREGVLSSLPRSLQHTLTHPLGLTYFFLNLTRKVTEKKKKRNRTNNKAFVHGKGDKQKQSKNQKEKKKKQQKQEHQKISIATATGVLLLASPHLCSLPVGRGR